MLNRKKIFNVTEKTPLIERFNRLNVFQIKRRFSNVF